jgi:IS30 family transposase
MANNLITIALIAKELNRQPDTVKRQLQSKGIKPVEYHGPTGMYNISVIEEIRIVPPVGRPKKDTKPESKAKPTKKTKK